MVPERPLLGCENQVEAGMLHKGPAMPMLVMRIPFDCAKGRLWQTRQRWKNYLRCAWVGQSRNSRLNTQTGYRPTWLGPR
jgi:hypothetical protein